MAKLSQDAKATSSHIYPSMNKKCQLLFELVLYGLWPVIPTPSRGQLGFLGQKKSLPCVLALAAVPGCEARAGMGEDTPVGVNGVGFNGVLSVWIGRKQDSKGQLSDTLRCVYKGFISAPCMTCNPVTKGYCLSGDKKVKLPSN